MRSSFLLFFLLILGTTVLAQDDSIKNLRGRVLADGKDVTGVVVRNNTSKRATITDFEGNFTMPVRLNDTLMFLAVQFKSRVLPITSSVIDADFVNVPLEEFVNELDEVVVRPFDLSGDLSKDAENLELPQEVSAETLRLPNADVHIISQSENKLYDADHGKFLYFYGAGFAINVNKILNRISGRTKMLKERVKLDKKYEIVQYIEKAFVDSLLVTHLNIPEDSYHDFIQYCEADTQFFDLANGKDELRFWQFLLDKSKVYRKNNNLYEKE